MISHSSCLMNMLSIEATLITTTSCCQSLQPTPTNNARKETADDCLRLITLMSGRKVFHPNRERETQWGQWQANWRSHHHLMTTSTFDPFLRQFSTVGSAKLLTTTAFSHVSFVIAVRQSSYNDPFFFRPVFLFDSLSFA